MRPVPDDGGDRDRRYVSDMLAQIDDVAEVIAQGEQAFFDPNSALAFRAAKSIIIDVSAAADRVSEQFKGAHPEIPWSALHRTRSKLAHHYEGIERELVWETITGDLPALAERLRALLE